MPGRCDYGNRPLRRQFGLIQFYGKFSQAELPLGLRDFNSHTLTQSLQSPIARKGHNTCSSEAQLGQGNRTFGTAS